MRPPDGRRAVLRLGRAHDGRGRRVATTRSATTSARSGRTTTRSSRWGLRRYGYRAEAARICARRSSRPRTLFDGRLPEAFAGYAAREHAASRSSTRPPAARRPGRRARRCCSCARCSASTPTASTSSSIRRCPSRSGQLELLDIPGRVGTHGRLRPRAPREVRGARHRRRMTRPPLTPARPFL